MKSSLDDLARAVARAQWEDLSPRARERVLLLLLDVLGASSAGRRLDPHPDFVEGILASGGEPEALVWFRDARLPAPHAALLNGTLAHHAEIDDGNSRASVHGGVTIVPAAFAAAETVGASGRDLLLAIALGYGAAVASGRSFLDGVERHRLHPPCQFGCVGAAAAASRLLQLDEEETAGALALAGTLMPVAPFEPFPRGAPSKDLYGGWPARIGVEAARFAKLGLRGPNRLFDSERDGPGSFLSHARRELFELDLDEVRYAEVKPWATCRAVHASLTALRELLPIDATTVASIDVETYPFAFELSRDSDPATPIGAKTSIPYAAASLVLDGDVGPDAFTPARLSELRRRQLAERVSVRVLEGGEGRTTRVTLRTSDGAERLAEASAPASVTDVRRKFRTLAGERAAVIESAAEALAEAPDLESLHNALR